MLNLTAVILARRLLLNIAAPVISQITSAMCQAVPKVAFQPDNADLQKEEQSNVAPLSPRIMHILVPFRRSFARVGYVDVGNSDGPVCLSLHGANGTLFDTFELAAPLTNIGMRFIAPEFPGYGNTDLDYESGFDESTTARAELLKNFLSVLEVQRVTTVVGHSLGVAVALHLAANSDADAFQSLVSLSGVGVRPHRAVRPYLATQMLASLLKNSWTQDVATRLLKVAYTYGGIDAEMSRGLACGVLSIANIDYNQLSANAELVCAKRLPALFTFTQNDRLIEWQIAFELAQRCGVDIDRQVTWFDDGENIIRGPFIDSTTIGWPRALVFSRGGHFVQRSHRDVVAESIVQLVRSVLRSSEQSIVVAASSPESFAEVHRDRQMLSG